VMAGWYARRSGQPPWILVASVALVMLFVASAYTTLNRTVWVAFAFQLIVLGTLISLRSRRAAITVALIATAILVGSATAILKIQAEREARGSALELKKDVRRLLWPQVAERIAERPLTGYGFGRGLLRQSLQEELGSFDTQLWHAHNVFLDAMLQTGLLGAALLLVVFGAILRESWAAARQPDDWRAACGMALAASVVGTLVRNMTDTLLVRQNALLFWGLVGVLLALSTRDRPKES
jgi:O-antigen ligase